MRIALSLAALVLVALVGLLLSYSGTGSRRSAESGAAVPIGILGDSDSQSYQGRNYLDPESPAAGGLHHASTLQWPEVLARIRERQVDLGEWGVWGVPRWMSFARVRDGLGLRWRGPRKEDYRHNLAWPSGCHHLTRGGWRQTQRLVELMDEDPWWWSQGVVIVRIGINDFGKESLESLAINPESTEVRHIMQGCIDRIRESVHLIRSRHPDTSIVLVGISNNAHWTRYFGKFQAPGEVDNIDAGLDYFDNGLREIVASLPHMAFFDDRAWFVQLWGGRGLDGKPNYKTVSIGEMLKVTNTAGDAPWNTTLANEHAGTAYNVLWVKALVDMIRSSFDTPINGVTDTEIQAFLLKTLALSH